MKKILLVNTNTENIPYPVPPLGLCLVAQSVEKKYVVKVFDAVSGTVQDLIHLIHRFHPDFIGVSIRNIDNVLMDRSVYYLQDIIDTFILAIRQHSDAVIIVGGSGFSIYPEEILRLIRVDYGIIGEGESSFLLLLNALENKKEPEDIPGVVYRKNDVFIVQKPVFSLQYEDIPVSGIHKWLQVDAYRPRGSYPVQTKRGCIFSCIYCSYPNLEGRKYRLRDPVDIADEIEDAYKRVGDVVFEFVDSTFNSPLKHAESICREIAGRKTKMRLRTMGINPKYTSLTFFKLMRDAGFGQIDCTPDTASPKMIRSLKKNFTLDHLRHCADYIRKSNMPTMWFFLFGGPGETEETVLETFAFIDKFVSPEDMVLLGEGIRILPDTELYAIAEREGIVKPFQNILEPIFYVSSDIGKDRLSDMLQKEISKRHNVVHTLNSAPQPEMLAEAVAVRNKLNLDEPMFRTLLRLKDKYSIAD